MSPYKTAIRYRTKLGNPGCGCGWNHDTAVEHAIDPKNSGKTLCGCRIGLEIESGGCWERSNWRDISCKRCQNAYKRDW